MDMRITLFNRDANTSMRVDMRPEDKVGELAAVASEAWGGRMVLRDGYSLLDPMNAAGCMTDGDVVEALPDPFQHCRWCEIGAPAGSAPGLIG